MNEKHDQGLPPAGAANSDPQAATSDTTNAAGGASAPTTLEEAVACIGELRATIARQEEEAAKLRDQYLRERAELENFKKRMQREKSEALRYATEPLLRDLLPVIDNLERALQAAPSSPGSSGEVPAEALRDGVEMVAQQFADILRRFGVARLDASGQPFDPSEHEALAHVETTLQEPGCVLDEHLPGYRLHDRLLRAAQVTVAKAPSGEGN